MDEQANLIPDPPPADELRRLTLSLQARKTVATVARDYERRLARVRRQKVKLAKLEEEARLVKRELEMWLKADVVEPETDEYHPPTS